ncbi:Hypothetical predicted protein, partial [Pelobates cultripes]
MAWRTSTTDPADKTYASGAYPNQSYHRTEALHDKGRITRTNTDSPTSKKPTQ